MGVGQRPRWLSRALAAEISHLLGSISSLKEALPPTTRSSQGLVCRTGYSCRVGNKRLRLVVSGVLGILASAEWVASSRGLYTGLLLLL